MGWESWGTLLGWQELKWVWTDSPVALYAEGALAGQLAWAGALPESRRHSSRIAEAGASQGVPKYLAQ